MTAKWADYGISAVKYNTAHTHIDKVRIYPDNGDKFGEMTEHNRKEIVEAINKKISFVTIIKGTDGNWKKGQPVFVIKINGQDYIKTVDNNTTVDNLGDLPEF